MDVLAIVLFVWVTVLLFARDDDNDDDDFDGGYHIHVYPRHRVHGRQLQ